MEVDPEEPVAKSQIDPTVLESVSSDPFAESY
jgi:hypothetical protein